MEFNDVGYLLKSIDDKLKVKADSNLKRYNLTFTQSRVLAFLDSRGGQSTQKEIELFLDVSHPTVVGIISRMEQSGHVICRIDEKDRRNKIVNLTEQANALGMVMEKNIRINEKKMLEGFSENDIRQLKEYLMIIYNNLNM